MPLNLISLANRNHRFWRTSLCHGNNLLFVSLSPLHYRDIYNFCLPYWCTGSNDWQLGPNKRKGIGGIRSGNHVTPPRYSCLLLMPEWFRVNKEGHRVLRVEIGFWLLAFYQCIILLIYVAFEAMTEDLPWHSNSVTRDWNRTMRVETWKIAHSFPSQQEEAELRIDRVSPSVR